MHHTCNTYTGYFLRKMEERVCLLFCDTFSHDNDQVRQFV